MQEFLKDGRVSLYHTPEGETFATFPVRSHYEHWPVASKVFKAYLHEFLDDPTPQELEAYVQKSELHASFRGEEIAVFTRIAEFVSSILRLGPLRSLDLAHLDIDILPHPAGYWF